MLVLLHASNYTKTDHVSQDVINLSRRNERICGTKTGATVSGSEGSDWQIQLVTTIRDRCSVQAWEKRILRPFPSDVLQTQRLWPYRNYVPLKAGSSRVSQTDSFRYWSRYPVRRRFDQWSCSRFDATGRKLLQVNV
jgi:hypothetical protein